MGLFQVSPIGYYRVQYIGNLKVSYIIFQPHNKFETEIIRNALDVKCSIIY